ncbi:tankyrase-2 [Iris pallida]|uniref:Tankyrase-2 n=1 Tax=Iris pallida TaxID=29817 RepID=A0AAX6GAN1_IRIPA|nr:tankyrase-2 [Iris pallida]
MDDTGAIHFASQKGHLEVVRMLLSSGVSVKATNKKGFTALHYAVQGSHPELIKYLVRKGAKLNAKTKAGETPSDLAKSEEVRSLLVECEQALKKEEQATTSKKDDDLVPKQSTTADDDTSSDAKVDLGTRPQDEENGTREKKRKGDVIPEESSLGPKKKARVSLLQHLVAEDDAPDEEDEYNRRRSLS